MNHSCAHGTLPPEADPTGPGSEDDDGVRRSRAARRTAFVCGYGAIFFLWLVVRPAAPGVVGAVSNFADTVAALVGLYWCLRGLPPRGAPMRAAALRIALGLAGFAVGSGTWACYEQFLHIEAPFPSWADAAFLSAYPLLLAGILRIPRHSLPLAQRCRILLDSVLIMTGLLTLSWYYLLEPTILQGGDTLLSRSLSLAFPLSDLLLLSCLIPLCLQPGALFSRRAALQLALGLAGIVLSDTVFCYRTLQETYASGIVTDAGWKVGYLLVGLAVRTAVAESAVERPDRSGASAPGHTAGDAAMTPVPPLWRSFLPYLLLPGVAGLLLEAASLPRSAYLRADGVYIGSALLVAQVLLRQVLAIRENRTLNRLAQAAYREAAERNDLLRQEISQREHAEKALRLAREELEARVCERTAELSHLNIVLQAQIRERRSAEDAVRRQQEFLHNVIDTDPNLIFVKDEDGVFRLANQAFADAIGLPVEEILGKTDAELIPNRGEAEAFVRDDLQTLPLLRERFIPAESLTDAAGNTRWLQTVKRPILDPHSGRHHILGIAADITDRKRFEEQLTHQAFHDALTGLPNRALFLDRLERALLQARRTKAPVTVLFVDLDSFKIVNDSLGHEAGDNVLRRVAQLIGACLRPGDTVARIGGDEFTVLLEDLGDAREALGVAERILETLAQPMPLAGREFFTEASIGIAVSRGEEQRPGDLLRDADTAMYQAKTEGKGRCIVFDQSMNDRVMDRLELETDLRHALERGEFRLHFQPIVALETHSLREVEALVRWEHPRQGLISPGRFIPIAEETGMIVPLGRWVLEEACRQARGWCDAYPRNPPLTISVNLSARQLQQPDLVAMVASALEETGWDPTRLKLEITESVVMADVEAAVEKLHRLRALGVQLAIDDFGTGYSSMAYLSALPVDTLKIDRSFVQRLGLQDEDGAIVRAIVSLARTLRLSVTCEGIETNEQLAYVKTLGCDRAQGFLFARPLTGSGVSDLLAAEEEAREADENPGYGTGEERRRAA